MQRRICLVTSGQPSTNPRLVKEANALAAAGHSVRVIGARRSEWATIADESLLARVPWSADFVDWRRAAIQHRLARLTTSFPIGDAWLGAAASPMTPALTAAALEERADMFIAHNLGALPAASAAASRHDAALGFDAEDFHSGQCVDQDAPDCRIAKTIEDEFIPRCDYVTASSPGIADTYGSLCQRAPVVILNVFSKDERPEEPSDPEEGAVRLYWFSQTIGPERGLDDAVRAIGRLRDARIELHLRGEWQAGYDDHLRNLARDLGLGDHQLVSHAPAMPFDLVRLAAPYDIGLALEPGTSVNSDLALSNKVFTFLLAGVPAILTATSAQRTLATALDDSVQVVGIGDVDALVHAIRHWVVNRRAYAKARQSAWGLGSSRYNWEIEQGRLVSVIEGVLAGRRQHSLRLTEVAP